MKYFISFNFLPKLTFTDLSELLFFRKIIVSFLIFLKYYFNFLLYNIVGQYGFSLRWNYGLNFFSWPNKFCFFLIFLFWSVTCVTWNGPREIWKMYWETLFSSKSLYTLMQSRNKGIVFIFVFCCIFLACQKWLSHEKRKDHHSFNPPFVNGGYGVFKILNNGEGGWKKININGWVRHNRVA